MQEASGIQNTVVLVFRLIHYFHLMYSEVAWALASSEN